MNFRDIIKVAALGAVLYGAYKLGERHGQNKEVQTNLVGDDGEVKFSSPLEKDIEHVKGLIKNLQFKPKKTNKEKDTLDLLYIKLEQLMKKI